MANRLIFNVKRKYFLQIVTGRKPFEYRLQKKYWEKRLVKEYDYIEIRCGYPRKDDSTRIVRRKWNGFAGIEDFVHKEFGPEPVSVFAIDVSEELDHR